MSGRVGDAAGQDVSRGRPKDKILKNLALVSLCIVLAGSAEAQHPCWGADRQVGRFLRAEEERFDSLGSIEHVLHELDRQGSLTEDLSAISRSVATKLGEQRELTRELMAALNRLRYELQLCARR